MKKNIFSIILTLAVVFTSFSMAYADDSTMTNYKENRNVQVERAIEDKEYLLDLSKLPKGYNHVNVIVDEARGTATIDGVSKASTTTIDGIVRATPSIGLDAYSTYRDWIDDYITFSLTCKAIGGKIKTYSGTAKITTPTGTKLSSFNFSQRNNAGAYTLTDEYTAYTGAYEAVLLKLSNQSAIDIYGRTGYIAPLNEAGYIR